MKLFKLVVVISVLVLSACSDRSLPKYHGYLYFGAGGYLGKLSLADGSSDVVTGVGNANIREVDELYGKRLLLSLDAIENNREVAKIIWLDVRTLQDTALFAGVAAVWVPDVKSYVYDDGSRLSAASTDPDFRTDHVIMDHRINDIAELIVVSGTAVLFQVGYAERREVWHYEVGSSVLTNMGMVNHVCGLRHSVWIAAQNLLACRSESTGRYVLVGLDGDVSAELPLPDGHDFEAIEYVADQQLIVFSEPWRSALVGQARNGVWVHELESGRTERIAEHQYLGNSTVYRRE